MKYISYWFLYTPKVLKVTVYFEWSFIHSVFTVFILPASITLI